MAVELSCVAIGARTSNSVLAASPLHCIATDDFVGRNLAASIPGTTNALWAADFTHPRKASVGSALCAVAGLTSKTRQIAIRRQFLMVRPTWPLREHSRRNPREGRAAETEHYPSVFGLISIRIDHRLLKLDGGPERIHRASELGQRTISSQFHETAAIPSQRGLKSLSPMRLESGKRSGLVSAHQAGVADNVSRQNCRQSALLTSQSRPSPEL